MSISTILIEYSCICNYCKQIETTLIVSPKSNSKHIFMLLVIFSAKILVPILLKSYICKKILELTLLLVIISNNTKNDISNDDI